MPLNEISISVMTINLRFGLAEDGANSWINRRNCFAPLFCRYLPDFIALQEANDFQITDISKALPDHDYIGKRNPAPAFWQSNVIFFHRRWRCVDSRCFFLSPTPHVPSRFIQSRWPRHCTMGEFQCGRARLFCADTHFDFKRVVQERSARLIMAQLDDFTGTPAGVITGDFNDTPDGPSHAVFTGDHRLSTPVNGFFKNTATRPFHGTHHGFTGKSDPNRHIDWILFRPPLALIEHEVITDRFNGRFPSDHFPVFSRFILRTDPPGHRAESSHRR